MKNPVPARDRIDGKTTLRIKESGAFIEEDGVRIFEDCRTED
ncbi:MAG: hypothetical protein ACE14T_01640 [Syntrophales bacterium]